MSRSIVFRFSLVLICAAAVSLSGCAKKPSANSSAAGAPADYSSFGQTPSDEECQKFADDFGKAILAGDSATANALIDWDSLLMVACAGVDAPADFREGFHRGSKKEMIDGESALVKQISAAVRQGGGYRALHIHEQDGQKRALFRLLDAECRLNYHDFILRRTGGSVKAVDVVLFATGEPFSQTLRKPYVRAAAESSKSIFAKLAQRDGDYVKSMGKMQEIIQSVREGRAEQAMTQYQELPESVKKEKMAMLLRIQATSTLGDKRYDEALKDFADCFPNDPCLDLLLIDSYFIHKQFGKGRATLNRLDKTVGGDPYLDVLRASMYLGESEYDKALQCARKAADAEQDLTPAYAAQVTVSLHKKDFAETARLLDILQNERGALLGDLTTVPEYAEFVQSPEYAEWVDRQK